MADTGNGSEAVSEATPDVFKWHGAEVIFIPLMMATGILGNALVLYITHFRWKHSIFSFFIKVLAWLDLSNLAVALPMLLAMTVLPDTPHFKPLCACTSFVALFTACVSATVLVVIAANRYRKLCKPSRSQVTLQMASKLTVGCFVIGAVLSGPSVLLFGKDTVVYNAGMDQVLISYCFIRRNVELSALIAWAVGMGLYFMAVTAALVVLYGFTIRALRQHDKRISTMMRRPSAVSTTSKTISKKHTLVFIVVTAVFFVTYSPYFVSVILLMADRNVESSMGPVAKAFFDLAKLCPLLSNVSNPLIYSFTSDKFRSECTKVFQLRPCKRLLNLQRKDSVTTSHEMSQSEES